MEAYEEIKLSWSRVTMLHNTGHDITLAIRAVDPPSFLADPDPAVILNTDPDPAVFFNADPDPA